MFSMFKYWFGFNSNEELPVKTLWTRSHYKDGKKEAKREVKKELVEDVVDKMERNHLDKIINKIHKENNKI